VFFHDHPDGDAFDPEPRETSRRDIELGPPPARGTFAAVGWRGAGLHAAVLAAEAPKRVDRLVLCCVPAPAGDLTFDPGAIAAKTLVIYGQFDDEAPARDAKWWKSHLVSARIEMVPRHGSDIIELFWKRILSHAAPNTTRKGTQ
jgi:pimeloyl-ACP methyl ester carboxylesterase